MFYLLNHHWIFWTVMLLVFFKKIHTKFEFTNLKCESQDKQFAEFEYCYLKSINRTYKYMSLKTILHKMPVTEFTIKAQFFKRSNGYVPLMSKFTLDGCNLISNKSHNPVATFFYGFLNAYTTLNRSCPVNHNIILEKLPIESVDYRLTKMIPFPRGSYLLNTTWLAYGIRRAVVQIFGTLS